jgi:hypothetical protein
MPSFFMFATLPYVVVVNQISIMSAYSITYKVSSSHVPVYILTCPPVHSEGMVAYLRKNNCKFHMVMERTKWERRHSIDRDVFYIEVCPQQVIDRLIKSTEAKGGQVNLPLADLFSGLRDSKTVIDRYRELLKVYHPDCGGNADEFSQLIAQFQQAMRVLAYSSGERSPAFPSQVQGCLEVVSQTVVDRLTASTQAKGGQVNLLPSEKLVSPNAPGIEVSLVICTETQEQVLEILFKGSEIPATGDDEDDYEWWNAQNNLDIKLKTFIETAITGKQNVVFYYDARINAGLADLLESCGFTYNGTEEAMRFSNK